MILSYRAQNFYYFQFRVKYNFNKPLMLLINSFNLREKKLKEKKEFVTCVSKIFLNVIYQYRNKHGRLVFSQCISDVYFTLQMVLNE